MNDSAQPHSTDIPGSPRTSRAILGGGDYVYEVIEDWAKLPDGWSLPDVGSVGVDRQDNVYVFNRGEHPMMVFDRSGNFLRSWGKGLFPRAHGLHMAPDDTIFLTDDSDHTVRRCTLDGKVLLTLGIPGSPAPFMSGAPFHRCTHTALAPNGDIYVSDGYGNARVHKFAPDGRHLMSWGECGIGRGEFNIPHNITCDPDGFVYVADRENHRIQVFDGNGRYQAEWAHLHRPCALFMPYCRCPVCYVGELGPGGGINRRFPNLGPRISIVDHNGNILARLGGKKPGLGPGEFIGPHGIAVDSQGDIYVGEVPRTFWRNFWPDEPVPDDVRSLRKLRRIAGPIPVVPANG
jgi:DNA-binding beta-propeller fold protein YncE